MRITALTIACTLAATAAALAEDQCPPLKRVASINLMLPRNGPALVPVSIGGQSLTFRLSTAAAQSAISTAAADRLQLARRNSAVTILNGRGDFSNTVAIASDFRIGTVRYGMVELREMIEAPNPNAPQGALAADLLRNYDVDLDFGAAKLNLISRDHCPDKVVYWPSKMLARLPIRVSEDNHIIFKATLDGHEIDATIETAQARTVLTLPVARSVFGIDASSPGAQPVGKNGDVFHRRFGTLAVEGLVVQNPDIIVVPDATENMRTRGLGKMNAARGLHQPPPLRLGMSTLRQLHVYIDYKNMALYITPAVADAAGATEPASD